ncbi:hypothetical protein [Pedobacter rhizosphaerae]|nr:hypothetical protein [Pedobacter rhizosphaerae]
MEKFVLISLFSWPPEGLVPFSWQKGTQTDPDLKSGELMNAIKNNKY